MFSKWKLFTVLTAILLVVAVMPSMALDITISGSLQLDTNPSDVYQIRMEAGAHITIFMNCTSGALDPYLEVYGPGGFFDSNDDGGSDYWDCNGSHYSSEVSFVAPLSGIYTIVATSYPAHYDDYFDTDGDGTYTLQIYGDFVALFDYNPDGRMNHGFGDLYAVIYTAQDDAGNPAIDIYCFDGEEWSLALRVTADTGNTSAEGCSVDVYFLETGEIQFNINYDGKLYTIICADLSCADRESSYFDPNE